ncbi:hypothetical protein MMC34_000728 [Xylographa carneopallida]|nr:hypothetical protein [Xylographa carneopallida]
MLGVFFYLVGSASVYGLALVVYRLTLHPLAKFPGPKFTAATKWWEFYLDVIAGEGGRFMDEVDQMHEKYGPIVRINPDEIHVKDSTWLDVIYSGPGPIRNKYAPSAHMSGVPNGTFGTLDHHVHRQRRSAVKGFVSKRTVRTAQVSIRETIEELCSIITQSAAKKDVFDCNLQFLAWSTDSVNRFLDCSPMGLLHDVGRAIEWKQTIRAVVELTPLVKQFPLVMPMVLHLPQWLVRAFSPDLNRILIMHKGMQASAIHAAEDFKLKGSHQIANPSAKPNAYHAILSSSLAPSEKEPNRLSQEILTLFVGGSATTARVMTRVAYHVTADREVFLRLRKELEEAMPDPFTTPELEELERLQYLTAVVKEALRIATALMSRLPLISPHRPLEYADWVIPAGTPVSMTPSSVLMDPSIFRNPTAFAPTRWLLGSPAEKVALERFFVPFGRGSRMCVGMNFAWAELVVATATIFRRFEFELHDTVRERDVDVKRDCFLGEPCKQSRGVRVRVVASASRSTAKAAGGA